MLDDTTATEASPAAARDFAPIVKRFPESTLDDEGHPVIRHYDTDAEGDPFWITFVADGAMKFHTQSFPYLMFCPVALERLAGIGREAQELYDEWRASESGKAWSEAED